MNNRIEEMCAARDFCLEMAKNFDNGSDERVYMCIAVNAIQEALNAKPSINPVLNCYGKPIQYDGTLAEFSR